MAHYDVIIAGAGPSGASAAYWLGESGEQVLVLEKEKLPRYKPCGGAVPKSVLARFPFDFAPVLERWVRRVRFRFRDGQEVTARLPEGSVGMVMRDQFDLHILNQSRAEVRDGSPLTALRQDEDGVEVTTGAGEILRARYLIGADGANSRVARCVGLREGKWMGGAIEVEIPADDDLLAEYADTALFIFGTPPQGYLWIFPKAGHLSVGIGTLGGKAPGMKQILRQEMARLGIRVDGARQHGHPLPVHRRREPLHRGRILLVGDAGGLIDPLLGEGIRHAVDSGRLAAESILADDPVSYTRRVHREIGADLLWGRRWSQLFYRYPRSCFELGARNPFFVEEFLRLFAGETTYRRMVARAVPITLGGLWRRLPVARSGLS